MTDKITATEYVAQIDGIATEIVDNAFAYGGAEDAEDIRDFAHDGAIHESVDGHQWIIYYAYNTSVLECSNNPGALEDEGLELDTSKGWRDIIMQVAFWAMRADVAVAVEEKIEELEESGRFD